jgi:signal transduction histidine kinase
MSHELRTPLNAIIGLTEMMTEHAPRFGTEKALEPLRRVLKSGRHLLNLINEILDLSKIEAVKLELSPESVNLAPLIDEVIAGSDPNLSLRRSKVQLEACPHDLSTNRELRNNRRHAYRGAGRDRRLNRLALCAGL